MKAVGNKLHIDKGDVFRTLFERDQRALAVLEGTKIVECNGAMLEIFGGTVADYIGKSPWEISAVQTLGGIQVAMASREQVREAYKRGTVQFDRIHQRPDGTQLTLDVSLTRIELPEGQRVAISIRDIAEFRCMEQTLNARTEFQARLTEISDSFATDDHEETDNRITETLRQIGEAYGLDRVRLWWEHPSNGTVCCSHDWDRDGRSSRGRIVKLAKVAASRILSGTVTRFHFTSVDELPEDAIEDRAFCAAEGVKSVLIVPIAFDKRIVGTASFATLHNEREWSPRIINELTLLAQTLGSAWQRDEIIRKLEESEGDLLRSQHVAGIGTYTETARPGEALSTDTLGIYELSRKASEVFGIEPGAETSELVLSRVHPEDRKSFRHMIHPGGRQSEEHVTDYRVVHPNGSTIHVEDRWETDLNKNGDVIGFVGTVMDVTTRVESNLRLRKALTEIEQLKDRLQDENLSLKRQVRSAQRPGNVVGDNPQFLKALNAAGQVAPTDVAVLILGETGTGKELIAREVHELSGRSKTPLISVNCAALSSELIESELFGHEVGAYTGAGKQRIGRFELADKGTLFLDEIGDLSSDVQAKILRVLQSGEFERLGGTETLQVDIRLIAATNRNLMQMVNSGEFRSDLFYRINQFPIKLPPLRERRDDIALLTNFLIEKHSGHLGKRIESVSPEMLHRLTQMEWPGNIRELESYVQRALIATTGSILDYCDADMIDTQELSTPDSQEMPSSHKLEAAQQRYIVRVLDQCDWIIGGENGAANSLGMPPSTLRSKMKRLGIVRQP